MRKAATWFTLPTKVVKLLMKEPLLPKTVYYILNYGR